MLSSSWGLRKAISGFCSFVLTMGLTMLDTCIIWEDYVSTYFGKYYMGRYMFYLLLLRKIIRIDSLVSDVNEQGSRSFIP